MAEMRGIYIAMVTPFNEDGSLALEAHKRNIEKWNRTDVKGYLVLGSTGEAVHLSYDEKIRLVEATLEAKAPDKKVFAGTGQFSTEETIRFTNTMADLGVDYALVVTPFFYKAMMTPKALRDHFIKVADESKIPVFAYNVPQYTGVNLPVEIVPELAEHENIYGLKDSSGNIYYDSTILKMGLKNFELFVGNFTALFQNTLLGAAGALIGVANVAPQEAADLYAKGSSGNVEAAKEIYMKLLKVNGLLVGKLGPAGVKYGMDLLGYEGLYPRSPLKPLTDDQKREVEKVLKDSGLLK